MAENNTYFAPESPTCARLPDFSHGVRLFPLSVGWLKEWGLNQWKLTPSPVRQLKLAVSRDSSQLLTRSIPAPRRAFPEGEPSRSPLSHVALPQKSLRGTPYSTPHGHDTALSRLNRRNRLCPLLECGKVLEEHVGLERGLWPFLKNTICQNVCVCAHFHWSNTHKNLPF